ncbi:hypothetical protein EAS62_38130 [Bradyrhizobium zhanjiangense]|uniref:Uncharacterized protein n=1 Tax=Bradyrhizobium zhanjiangense TaxID=1325107 RepID=A0ABY0D8W5_9BRAD|nr:hypothetical protein EAS62_38130 [Bradyrhizobium zhanjiangense]
MRDQIALLGISGLAVTGATCLVALNYSSAVKSEFNDNNQFETHVASLSESFLDCRKNRKRLSA